MFMHRNDVSLLIVHAHNMLCVGYLERLSFQTYTRAVFVGRSRMFAILFKNCNLLLHGQMIYLFGRIR